MIEVFTANTPNGIKVPIALEELGVPYDLRTIALGSADLRSAEYLRINPNAKIPAIRHLNGGDGPVTVFESGAILLYLAEAFGGLLGTAPAARGQTLSWLFLQVAGLGPMMGNAAHFRAMRSPDPYTIGRFEGEAGRHLAVLETHLHDVEWLNGESYSIADIAHFSWVRSAGYAGFELKEFPILDAWVQKIENRAATARALARLG
ncbi:glutathione S-transferase family protein [Porphyrobacter sp. ULC335]|uniref:glutathione S-transferase family protein n=1 Tax=Porphyrobacter sp. ULC335 TaxID=2854260 RepID=UPI00221EB6B8|nr:glutathione S-transferase N-terminal domain-containing protein [Porphyrobacter sp. ULC335]UYV15413.1 glutathione S-transferase N-terminal domain-containing protein [Porphyrobacter sp. ULC335]